MCIELNEQIDLFKFNRLYKVRKKNIYLKRGIILINMKTH